LPGVRSQRCSAATTTGWGTRRRAAEAARRRLKAASEATPAQIDEAWLELEAKLWFFDVRDRTIIDLDVKAPCQR
jgi:hypothetical protein